MKITRSNTVRVVLFIANFIIIIIIIAVDTKLMTYAGGSTWPNVHAYVRGTGRLFSLGG